MKNYIIYVDGAFSPTKKVGGIAFVILDHNENIICDFSKKFINTTNQRMEQLAVAIALESIKTSSNIIIYSDSAYVVNTYEKNWKRKCNLDLWDRIDRAIKKHNIVKFIHVKGHIGNKYNEMCDFLARQVSES